MVKALMNQVSMLQTAVYDKQVNGKLSPDLTVHEALGYHKAELIRVLQKF